MRRQEDEDRPIRLRRGEEQGSDDVNKTYSLRALILSTVSVGVAACLIGVLIGFLIGNASQGSGQPVVIAQGDKIPPQQPGDQSGQKPPIKVKEPDNQPKAEPDTQNPDPKKPGTEVKKPGDAGQLQKCLLGDWIEVSGDGEIISGYCVVNWTPRKFPEASIKCLSWKGEPFRDRGQVTVVGKIRDMRLPSVTKLGNRTHVTAFQVTLTECRLVPKQQP